MSLSPRPAIEQDPDSSVEDVVESPRPPRLGDPSTKIGEDQTPGQANEGTVLDSIETAIARRIQSDPKTNLKEMHTRVSAFPVVLKEGREVCPFYISDCIDYYRALYDGSASGQSAAASTSHTDSRSQVLSSRSSRTSAPSLTDGGLLSTLALEDLTNTIAIILPNDDSKPMRSAKRDGNTSYISQAIVERCGLKEISKSKVVVELRHTITVNDRGRVYRVPDCVFRIRPGLETDLAIGREVQEKLQKHVGHPEYSYDPDNSTEDLVSIDGRRKPASIRAGNVEASSHAGSSHRGSLGTATSKDYVELIHRVLDADIVQHPADDGRAHRSRHDRHHLPPPESSGRSRHLNQASGQAPIAWQWLTRNFIEGLVFKDASFSIDTEDCLGSACDDRKHDFDTAPICCGR
ncbi:hypothetical protein BKA67DRAFT_537545 [Truncatella angustata]|uniref:Uncharacterized protein n=1 Tax=Truncatella angustata TaxID=152316 RepID=A0A9P8UGC2_9PEZI|nr:uncharacterized protein BKA67DRAFT_537545 [Truncatella angustata]KAH6651685.1 hypothetical protein BKA67DRAFT_537545 [Truncatella angustata]